MKIKRTSSLTGAEHEREVDITPEQLARWEAGELIQLVAPHLSADDREFIISGITPEEWQKYVVGDGDEEEDDDDGEDEV